MPTGVGGAVLAIAVLVAGVALLSASWRRRDGGTAHLLLGGWLLIVAGLVVLGWMWGGELGTTYGLLAFSLAGYGAVAAGAERRRKNARAPRELALEPEERQTNWPRGVGKAMLAIVLAGIASLGLGIAFAVAMPIPVHDRIVIGGLLVPVLWGGGMAWTLSDARLLRATIVLISAACLGYGVAFLPKVLP